MTIASRSSGGGVYYYNRFDGEAVEQHVKASFTMIHLIWRDRRFERPLKKRKNLSLPRSINYPGKYLYRGEGEGTAFTVVNQL